MSVTFRSVAVGDTLVEVIIDTGFIGDLTLPASVIEALRLPSFSDVSVRLADDSIVDVGMFSATIVWNGREREIQILAMGGKPLLGTLLLDGHTLTVEFTEGGAVSVQPL